MAKKKSTNEDVIKLALDEKPTISVSESLIKEINSLKDMVKAQKDLIIKLTETIENISNDLNYAHFGYHTIEHKDVLESIKEDANKLKKKKI